MLKLRHHRHTFWTTISEGGSSEKAAASVDVNAETARRWLRHAGGVAPPHLLKAPSGRYLSPVERASIMVADRQGMSIRAIATMLGRAPSTISREMRRNRRHWMPRYHAGQAQLMAEGRAPRPQPSKLATNPQLRRFVEEQLDRRWSPEQISARLPVLFPADESMRVSHETIYRGLYRQAKGSLRLKRAPRLRSGKQMRRPRRQAALNRHVFRGIPDLIPIGQRPLEVATRLIPGHWEGDLIVGPDTRSHIGTLVERTSRYCVLVHLPESKKADAVAAALVRTLNKIPRRLRKSLTWDRGTEMRDHAKVTLQTGTQIYFCDPRSPWQRGSNENTNGLLRQYFPKGTDLSRHSPEDLEFVARELNTRPRKALGWRTPAEVYNELLLTTKQNQRVATMT
ncbi:IS30 family transposase [Leifsonia sp. NPDC014704]|uniref:IS30 family transposase n=1 Tax=Leifsonia sp. NPDC014704 TaxID=3364123 RepID=UPI0036F45519